MPGFKWAQCRRVRPVLWDYVGERLSEGPMELVEEHLQTCASCRREAASLKNAQNFLTACRAEEEPTPRSNWNAVRGRIVAEGSSPVFAAGLQTPMVSHGDNSAWNPRAAWRMQMLTSMAGGFAAVLLVAAGYGLAHLHQPAPTPTIALAVTPNRTVPAPAVVAPVSNSQEKEIIASVAQVLNSARVQEEASDTPAKVTNKATLATASAPKSPFVATSHKRVSVSERRTLAYALSARRMAAKSQTAPTVRQVAKNTSEKSPFRPYKSTVQDRLPEATQIAEANSRYALEHVRPVGYDDGEYSTYVVGSVRPVSRDDEHDY